MVTLKRYSLKIGKKGQVQVTLSKKINGRLK
jgi:hypothetical protein